MEYENTPISSNIEDRRGQGGGGMGMGGGGLGLGAIIVIFAISYFTGIDPAVLMGGAEMVARNSGSSYTQPVSTGPAVNPNDPTRKFLAHVLGAGRPRASGRRSCRSRSACAIRRRRW
jgi:uncharacterized protein